MSEVKIIAHDNGFDLLNTTLELLALRAQAGRTQLITWTHTAPDVNTQCEECEDDPATEQHFCTHGFPTLTEPRTRVYRLMIDEITGDGA